MPQISISATRPKLHYLILVLLFLLTAGYQFRHAIYVLDYTEERAWAVTSPGVVNLGSPVVQSVSKETEEAGLRPGDTILALNGRPYRGLSELIHVVEFARPGDFFTLTVRHKNGPPFEETLRIPLVQRKEAASDHWFFVVVLHLLLPLCCVVLGFWVSAVRPRDPLAWLLLALLLGFSQLFSLGFENEEGTLTGNLALAFHLWLAASWFIWLFLMGLYFPSRLAFERRAPWLKWIVIVPLGISSVMQVVLVEGLLRDDSFAEHLLPYYQKFSRLFAALPLLAVVLFFTAIIVRYFLERTADAKRRLRLLYAGIFLALMPTITLLIVGSRTGRALDDFPPWIELPCLLMAFLFPLTLAYLIVIHKAMDVRVVIRQGVQYALARGGVAILQGTFAAGLVVALSYVVASHRTRLPQTIALITIGMLIILRLRWVMQRVAAWIDRRFFREAYNAELLLADLSEKVRTMVEIRPLLETVAGRIAESLHVPRIAVLLEAFGPYRPAYALGYDGALDVTFPQGGTVQRMRESKEPARIYLTDPASWVQTSPGVTEEERQRLEQLQAELLLPLLVKDRLLGFISLSQKRSEEAYSGNDLRLLNSVASQTALALENARLTAAIADEVAHRERLNRELEIAREVQEHLLPQELPVIEGLDYAGICRPALGVGGDYYDFIELPEGRLMIAVGDVSGKGISAALMMANLQACLRSQAATTPDDLSGIVARINQLIFQASSSSRYATFFLAEYDPATRHLSYVNAGHNPPLLFRQRGDRTRIERLDAGGPVVGLMRQFSFQQAGLTLEPGDLLVAFTDGITESMNPEEEEWGEDALVHTVQGCKENTANEIVARTLASAEAFAAGAQQHDDMTLVVMQVVPN
ncbi:MAG: SpoIIE family protein phosphatase [Acidobacteriia bacterium]|nr:SpoIIE family protein phosphatase [Terriglobia bacterium]